MGKESKAKKLRKLARLDNSKVEADEVIITDNVIPGNMLVSYLLSKFIGMNGYNYISIGKYKSLCTCEDNSSIAVINMHRDMPMITLRGKYSDINDRNYPLSLIHVPESWPGLVVDRHANIYLNGSNTPATDEEKETIVYDLQLVSDQEFQHMLVMEKANLEDAIKKRSDEMHDAADNLEKVLQGYRMESIDPYGNPIVDAYGNPIESKSDDEAIEIVSRLMKETTID